MNVLYFHPHYSPDFRPLIFLITSVCVGLPALVWALRLLYLHIKIRGRISAFIVLLLLSDLIQLLLNIYIVTQLLTKLYWTPDQFWSGLHWCGFQLHQLVALEGVLTLKYPLFSARICSVPCYIIIIILVLVFSVASGVTANNPVFAPFLFSLGTSLAPLSLLVTCKAPPTPVSKNTYSVFIVAIVTSVMLYLPFMLIICMKFFISGGAPPSWYMMSVCLMSLRVISDPLLCVLVCRGNLRDVQTPQKHTEP